MTTSEERASAVRAATTDVAAPTASAAFSNNPRRLTPVSPSVLRLLDIARPRVGRMFRLGKIAPRFKPRPAHMFATGPMFVTENGLLSLQTVFGHEHWS